MIDWEAYHLWLEDAERTPGERAERWAKLMPVPIHRDRWRQIVEDNCTSTWDAVVECSDDITQERDIIVGLYYYGQAIHKVHAHWLWKGEYWKANAEYVLTLTGPEGAEEVTFKTLEEAGDYIKARIQWCSSGESFQTDYINYALTGFTLQDIGINPGEWRP